MKNLIVLLFILPCFLFAQNDEKEQKIKPKIYKWEIGFNGGFNLTNISGIDSINTLYKSGRLYGITLIYHFNRFFSIKGDFDFENKGWIVEDMNYNINGIDTTGNITQVLNYFDLPAHNPCQFQRSIPFVSMRCHLVCK